MNGKSESKPEEMQGAGWKPAAILAEIRKRGATTGSLARHLGVSRTAVYAAIQDAQSWAICEFVAAFIGEPIDKLWPQITGRERRSTSNAATRAMAEASK